MEIFDYDRYIITYKGKEYPFRVVWFDEDDSEVIISTTMLSYEVFDKYNDWSDALAEYIDNKIIFYVSEDEIKKSDKYLQYLLNENILC